MHTSLAIRVSTLSQQMLAHSGLLRSELRRLDQAGLGHGRMRELCDALDSLDSGIHWDLQDELRCLDGKSTLQSARIIDWLGSDMRSLERLVGRLAEQCSDHPMVSVSLLACREILALYQDIEVALGPISFMPPVTPGITGNWQPVAMAAENPQLC